MKRVVLLLLVISIGCSSDKTTDKNLLDKDTAASEIKSYLHTSDNAISVQIGRVGTHCEEVTASGQKLKVDLTPDTDLNAIILKRAGYVTVAPDGKGLWKVALTDQGNAVLEASKEKPYQHNTGNGCNYQQVDFTLATPELVRIDGISADPNTPQVDYWWKWNATDLGQALRRDGKIYPTLTPLQQAELQSHMRGLVQILQMPVPPEDFTGHDKAKFTKYTDGWRIS